MADEPDDNKWHLDKKVPLAIIFTMVAQIVIFSWWGGGFSNRVEQLERQMATMAPQSERIIRVETKVDAMSAALAEIKQLLARPARDHQ